MNVNNKIHDEYFESSYKHGNLLTKEQFDLASEGYGRMYKKYLPINKEAAILDLGCGVGDFLYHLKENNYSNFYGIDISSSQIDYCKKNISQRVEVADGFSFLQNKSEAYDLITAHDVMEHIAKDDILKMLDLIIKSLKSGGTFMMRVPNMSNPFGLDARYNDFTHQIGYTSKSLYQVLYLTGFRDIEILPPVEIPVKSLKNFIRKWLVKALHQGIRFCYYIQDYTVPKNLDKNLVVVAKKV